MHSNLCLRTILLTCVALGLASSAFAQLDYPLDVAATTEGTQFIADRNLPGGWKIEGGQLTKFFAGRKQFRTPLNAVRCVAIDRDGHLLAGDSATREVYRFDPSGQPTPLTGGQIGIPMGIGVLPDGNLLVADLELHRVWQVPAAGGKPEVLAELKAPHGVCVDAEGKLWAVSHGPNQVVRWGGEKRWETVVEGTPFQFPHEIVVAPDKTAYVSDGYAKAIWRIPAGGKPEKWVSGEPLKNPVGLALRDGQLLVADPHAKAIFQIDAAGKVTSLAIKAGE
jgi:sugar lactone lactonase YvrE